MFDDLQKKQEKIDDIFADIDGGEGKEKTPFKQSPSDESGPIASNPVSANQEDDNTSDSTSSNLDPEFSTEKNGGNVLKKLIILIVVLVFLGVGAYFVYSMFLMPQSDTPVDPMIGSENPPVNNDNLDNDMGDDFTDDDLSDDPFIDDGFVVEDDPFMEDDDVLGEDSTNEDDPNEVLKLLDSDNDGISDYDEIFVYGTDPNNEDTDIDGLTDWEEVFIFGTDPLALDTDADSFEDGAELNNCYNPLGEGALNPEIFLDTDLFYERYPNLVEKCEL